MVGDELNHPDIRDSASSFLYHLHADVMPDPVCKGEPGSEHDAAAIRTFVSMESCDRHGVYEVQHVLRELKIILEMKPFPWRWLLDLTLRYPFDDYNQHSPEGYRHWLEWVYRTLEAEARKAGQL